MIENDQVHAALGIKKEQRMSPLFYRELCTVSMACVCTAQHPLAEFNSLTKEQLTGNFIACSPRQIPDSVFSIQSTVFSGLRPEQRYFAENIESAFALAKAQMGYTLYPDLVPARIPDLKYIPVTDLPKLSFGIYYRYTQDQPVLKRFITLMSRYIKTGLTD